jgi:3-oxoacyl-[acyl-carrier-protein] synthase II
MRTTDHRGRPVVVVTGMGVVSSLGVGQQENWRRLTAGESGIRTIRRFPIEGLRTTIAGTVDFAAPDPLSAPELSERIAILAIEEALAESGIGTPGDFPGPLFLAFPPVEMEWTQRRALAAASGANARVSYADLLRACEGGRFARWHETFLFGSVAEHLADRFGTQGSPISISTACASGATAIQQGVEAIRRGETEAALCVGTDASVNAESLIRFSLLSALSTRNEPPEHAARPFSKDRDGFVMAEGCGALVLESLAAARARGARILAVVEGCGELADSFHRTRSNPDGRAIIGCIRATLDDAGVAPDQVSAINAHGTGTPENDKMEHMSLSAVFGPWAKEVPITSNKSMIGHTLTAAGAIEAVFSILGMRTGRLPPTINHAMPDPAIDLNVVGNVARDIDHGRVLSNSFGFGGQNVSLVLAREPA